MKFLPPILAWLTLLATSFAEITIELPDDPIAVGTLQHFFLGGVTKSELAGSAELVALPKGDAKVYGAYQWENQPFIVFKAKVPGVYHIVLGVPKLIDGKAVMELASVSFVVGGPQPNPFPPVPPVPPVPPGELSCVILCETQTRTGAETLALVQMRAYAAQANLAISIVDKDLVSGSTNLPPPWLIPYLEALGATFTEAGQPIKPVPPDKIPAILLSGLDGVFAVEPLTTGEAAIALVKKWGG